MGTMRDRQLAAWQAKTGIQPATGERAQLLNALSEAAYGLIIVIERERSGIRDGDGGWSGSGRRDARFYRIVGTSGRPGQWAIAKAPGALTVGIRVLAAPGCSPLRWRAPP